LIRISAEKARQRSTLHARAMQDGLVLRAMLTGEDLCSQQGPMASPEFLRREYFPLLEYSLEPLLEAGAKIVWHCDGNPRPLLDDILACGIGGLQGFQRECGMALEWIVDLRTRDGEPLIIFGPMSVTETLPYGTPDEVRAVVQRAMTLCRDKASLVFFTSNTINPDVPLENVRAYWQSVLDSGW
jgi:uroporphyrinogen decarboxylase